MYSPRPHPLRPRLLSTLLALVLVPSLPALAHQPSYSEGQHDSPENAWAISDIDLSIVLYHPATCESPHLWLGFRAEEPRDIFYQLGVPEIDRLDTYRPSIALLAPGLPAIEEELPFTVPEGLGGIITHTRDVEEPEEFFEPFTQTSSWILEETTQSLPEAGVGYLVAWHPEGQSGKFWVAVGDVEDFSDVDWDAAADWSENTQRFHEEPPYVPDPPIEEVICEQPEPEPEPEPEPVEREEEAPQVVGVAPAEGAEGCESALARAPIAPLVALLLLCAWACIARRPEPARRPNTSRPKSVKRN